MTKKRYRMSTEGSFDDLKGHVGGSKASFVSDEHLLPDILDMNNGDLGGSFDMGFSFESLPRKLQKNSGAQFVYLDGPSNEHKHNVTHESNIPTEEEPGKIDDHPISLLCDLEVLDQPDYNIEEELNCILDSNKSNTKHTTKAFKGLQEKTPPKISTISTLNAVHSANTRQVGDIHKEVHAGIQKLQNVMMKSAMTQRALQDWDKESGLPKNHCKTMTSTNRSRMKLQEQVILSRHGNPLILEVERNE